LAISNRKVRKGNAKYAKYHELAVNEVIGILELISICISFNRIRKPMNECMN